MLPRPEWLRLRNIQAPNIDFVEDLIAELGLNTVCREANCPNFSECFSRKTATFLIMGTNCTRNCRFCNVRHDQPQALAPGEPRNVALAVSELGLKYVVVTSVTRDDLPDGGAGHFAETVMEIKEASPGTAIEVLIPDLMGSFGALETIAGSAPDVISHNMETVEALYAEVRPQAVYQRSLDLLRNVKLLDPGIRSKSGFMVGLGESGGQVMELLGDLRGVGCEFVTIGQYLAPSKQHFPIHEYIEPSRFEEYGAAARRMGFAFVASAPLVRSSYNAGEALAACGPQM